MPSRGLQQSGPVGVSLRSEFVRSCAGRFTTAAAVNFILRSPLDGSDAGHAVIVRDTDLDLSMVVNPNGEGSAGLALSRTLQAPGSPSRPAFTW